VSLDITVGDEDGNRIRCHFSLRCDPK
jgi:hypothetical protein